MKNFRSKGIVTFIAFALLLFAFHNCLTSFGNSNLPKRNNASTTEVASRDQALEEKTKSETENKEGDISLLPTLEGIISSPIEVPLTDSEWISLNKGTPLFQDVNTHNGTYILFSELDQYGRCGIAEGCLGPETLPTEERTGIGMIKPSGWHTVKYDFIDGRYLYNRCHLIAYELCGVNADERNLITGTRSMNVDAMLPFENQVCWYIQNTGNHVLYRVTPWFEGDNLIASGVQIEALSIEDNGKGICLNVYCYNKQSGVIIDYLTGESQLVESATEDQIIDRETQIIDLYEPSIDVTYVLNINTYRFHLPTCPSVYEMKAKNRYEYYGSRDELISDGYKPCGRCHP